MCYSDSLCWKISKDLGLKRIEFERIDQSVAFLPSQVLINVNTSPSLLQSLIGNYKISHSTYVSKMV